MVSEPEAIEGDAQREGDVCTAQGHSFENLTAISRSYDALHILKMLLEDSRLPKPPSRQRQIPDPVAGHTRRDDPHVDWRATVTDLVWLPAAERPRTREDPGAGPCAFEYDRPQEPHQLRKQPHRHDGCVTEIHVERVLMLEADSICQALAFRLIVRVFHELGIDLDAAAPQACIHPRRRQWDQTVTRSEVNHDVVVLEIGQLEQPSNAFRGAGLEKRESFLPLRL